jgi:thiamine thiazole synthase
MDFNETIITREIIKAFDGKLLQSLESNVLIAGAGPSGLVAGYYLAREGFQVTVIEKRLSPGGGIWGGGMAMNEVVVQESAASIVKEFGIRMKPSGTGGLSCIDSMEMGSALCLKALHAGVHIFNLMCVEDVCVSGKRVTGLVVNRTTLLGNFPVDPIMFKAGAVLDATGHEAAVVQIMRKHGYKILSSTGEMIGEGAMDAPAGEAFVEERTGEVYPGLFVSGMAVCATFGGPRMGPIFGGMLLSGKKAASLIHARLKTTSP